MLPLFVLLNRTLLLNECLLVIATHFQDPVLIYHDNSGELIHQIAQFFSNRTTVLVFDTSSSYPSLDYFSNPRSIIVFGKSSLSKVENLRDWRMWQSRNNIIVISEDEEDTQTWLEKLWNNTRAVNVVVAVLSSKVSFYTWNPYRVNECSSVKTISKLSKSELFTKKIPENLAGCPLLATTDTYEPYVVNKFDGIEPRIVLTIVNKMNLTLVYKPVPSGAYFWVGLEDDKPTGVFKKLNENKIDIMYSVYTLSYGKSLFADDVGSHTDEHIIVLVPTPDISHRSSAIYRAFSMNTWLYVISVFLTMLSVVFVILCAHDLNPLNAFFYSIALTINGTTLFPEMNSFRIFQIMSYWYSLHMVTAYQATLFYFLANPPRDKGIETLEDLLDSNLKISAYNGYKNTIIIASSSLPVLSAMLNSKRWQWTWKGYANSTLVSPPFALFGPLIPFQFQTKRRQFYDETGYPKVKILKESVLLMKITKYMSRGHPLIPRFRLYTQYLIEGGFPTFYSKLVSKSTTKNKEKTPFAIENVEGAFIILFGLIAISFFVFLCELLFYYAKKWWKLLIKYCNAKKLWKRLIKYFRRLVQTSTALSN